jgi:hypothetical protein
MVLRLEMAKQSKEIRQLQDQLAGIQRKRRRRLLVAIIIICALVVGLNVSGPETDQGRIGTLIPLIFGSQ